MNTDQIMMCEIECGDDELLDAQMDYASLNVCWAKLNESNFVIDHGLLYHTDQVEGQKVCELCVPKLKRDVTYYSYRSAISDWYCLCIVDDCARWYVLYVLLSQAVILDMNDC